VHQVEQLQQVLKQKPLALLFDIDGTLSPIASRPGEARLHPEVRPLLEQAREWAQIVVVTGRAIESGAAIVNLEGITYIGTHGLEWCEGLPTQHPVWLVPEAQPFVDAGKRLLDYAEQQFNGLPGVLVERKRVGGSVHYRLSPDPEQTRRTILSMCEPLAQKYNLRLSEGKMVVEIKAPIDVDKGLALRSFVEKAGVQGAVFAGDDRTDMDALRELRKLRVEGVTTLGIAVQHPDTLPELLEQADIVVYEVEGMVTLLHEIVHILRSS
jgi:trehalose 6-phosphate phosphatase